MKEVWVCSQGVIEKQPKGHCRWYKNGMCALKGHTELTMQGTVGPFPCDAKKFVEEKVGKWLTMKGATLSHCSACKESVMEYQKFNYCPNCGARMTDD